MERQPSSIVFQCYGNEAIFHECAFALLSLSRLYKPDELANVQVWIYTDKPEWFQKFEDCTLPLNYRRIDDALVKKWSGEIAFVHRVKIEALRHFAKEHEGNVLYVDSDVVFIAPLEPVWHNISGGECYMHVYEGLVKDEGNPTLQKLSAWLAAQKDGRDQLREKAMWNAGVLGFHTELAPMLDEALAFTDELYPAYPKHIAEQFAFSIQLQRTGDIKAAAPWVLHYWNLKELRPLLASFFTHFKGSTWQQLTAYSSLVQVPVLMQQKTNFYENRTVAAKLKKDKWQAPIPDWNLLAKQL